MRYEDLQSIDAPVLVIHGEDDQIVPLVGSYLTNGQNDRPKRPTLRDWSSSAKSLLDFEKHAERP